MDHDHPSPGWRFLHETNRATAAIRIQTDAHVPPTSKAGIRQRHAHVSTVVHVIS
tara:strand:- start:554 stop:718 length:165 start_codon:yes stop_codon:yes gene_type:complete